MLKSEKYPSWPHLSHWSAFPSTGTPPISNDRRIGAIAKAIIHAAEVAAAHRIVAGIVEQIALAALGVLADKALQFRIIEARTGVIQSARIELHPGPSVLIALPEVGSPFTVKLPKGS